MTSDLRTRILDAAIKLLETEGSKAFGQTRIARAAGVKQGNITYHFPKKADLVAAVVERVNERRVAEFQDLLERAHKLEPEKLRALVVERLPALATDVKRSRVMFALMIEAEHDPAIGKLLISVNRQQLAPLATLLQRDPDDPDLALALVMLSGLSLHSLSGVGPGDGPHSDRVAALIQQFRRWLTMLLGTAPPAQAPPTRRRGASRASPRVRTSPA